MPHPHDPSAWLYEITGRQALGPPNEHDRLHWTEVGDEADEYDHTLHESGMTLGMIDRIIEYEEKMRDDPVVMAMDHVLLTAAS